MSRYIAIECDGIVQVHAEGLGSYATLCGLDGNDSKVGQKPATLLIGARIDCPTCIGIIQHAKKYRARDFAHHPTQARGDVE